MPPLYEKGFLGTEINESISKIRDVHSDFFKLSDEFNSYCQKSMYKFDVHSKNKQEILVSTLFIRILNNYQAAILLAERGLMPQSRSLTRTLIDALFSLCAISKNEKYADDFIHEDQRSRLRFLNKYRELHGGLPPEVNKEEIKSLEKELQDEIQNNEIKKKSFEQWSKDAGMHDWYLSAYSVLSESVHSKVKDLERYLVLDENNEIKEFRWGPDDHDIENLLMTLIQSMLTGLNCAFSLFDEKKLSELESFQERLNRLVTERLISNE